MVGSSSGIQESRSRPLEHFCTQEDRQAKIDRASLTARNSPSPIPAWPYGTESRGAFVPCYIPASSRFLLLCSPLCPALSLGCNNPFTGSARLATQLSQHLNNAVTYHAVISDTVPKQGC